MKQLGGKRKVLLIGSVLLIAFILLSKGCEKLWVNTQFKRDILIPLEKEYPEFYMDETTDFEKVNILREFVYRNSVFANGSEMLLDINNYLETDKNEKKQVLSLFDLTIKKQGGFYCDGFATMLTLLYRSMGYEAVNLNMIIDQENGHALTLVKVGELWIVEDATFNQVYIKQDGEPLDIREIITYLRLGEDKNIVTQEGDYKYRFAISTYSPAEWGCMYPYIEVLEEDQIKKQYFYLIDSTRKYYEPMDSLLRKALSEEGYPSDEKYIFLYSQISSINGRAKNYEIELQNEIARIINYKYIS